MTKLKDITGKALSGEWGTDDETGVGIPVLRTTNFTNEGIVNYENVVTRIITKKDISEKYLQSGDIIIEKSGGSDKQPVGRVIYFDGPENTYLFNNFTGLLRVRDKNEWFPRYVFYSLFANYKKGGTRPFENKTTGLHNLKTDDYVSRYEITEIPLNKQVAICAQLDQILKVINLRRKEISNLDDLIKARFVEMFGDPKLNDKGWNSGIISDYYEVKGGKRIPKGMGYADGITAHPYLRATDMKNETILDDDIHYIDDDVFERIKRYTVKGGDIYLTNVGVNLGMAGVIPEKYDGANLTENAVKLVPKTEKVIDGVFWAYYINSPGIQDYINERKMSVGVPKLAIFRIETMPLLLPPIELQMKFIEFVNQIDKSKLLSGCRLFHSWAPEIEKSESCWRAPTEDKGFAGRSTPTMTPADRKNLNRVGVPRRRTKDLRGCRRQQ